jgi:hypothetical protein
MCHYKERKIYFAANIYNSDELVMSRGNRKNFTYAFCKSGALHLANVMSLKIVPILCRLHSLCRLQNFRVLSYVLVEI